MESQLTPEWRDEMMDLVTIHNRLVGIQINDVTLDFRRIIFDVQRFVSIYKASVRPFSELAIAGYGA